jgi:serine/threonine protein kinase
MNFPDFSQKGYQIIEELGHNHAGGRVTYLASKNSEEKVVIKEFQFAKNTGNSWGEYDAYQREIEVLQGLNHPGIPRYLDSFETDRGFCLVQEYKNAQSLSVENAWAAKDIKKIAIALLEILAYLQNRIPPVFHRDIKPENILVDGELNVYLVDFGFAHIGQGEVAMSSKHG